LGLSQFLILKPFYIGKVEKEGEGYIKERIKKELLEYFD